MRLDSKLIELHSNYNRATLQKFIRSGMVKVNGELITKTGYAVKETDKIGLVLTGSSANTDLEELDLEVLYEDSDCVVLHKPCGILTHSKGVFNPESTVATWLTTRAGYTFANEDSNARLGIVHRLDRATSGVMICAKNQAALTHLQKQFQDRKAKKTYIARVEGKMDPTAALIDLPIERNPKQPQKFRVGQNGKSSQTEYRVIKEIDRSGSYDSVLELKPTTGRTHQLRVHLNYLKHPIVGDTFYDGREAKRLFLHAKSLEITLPSRERKTFTAEESTEFYEDNI